MHYAMFKGDVKLGKVFTARKQGRPNAVDFAYYGIQVIPDDPDKCFCCGWDDFDTAANKHSGDFCQCLYILDDDLFASHLSNLQAQIVSIGAPTDTLEIIDKATKDICEAEMETACTSYVAANPAD